MPVLGGTLTQCARGGLVLFGEAVGDVLGVVVEVDVARGGGLDGARPHDVGHVDTGG